MNKYTLPSKFSVEPENVNLNIDFNTVLIEINSQNKINIKKEGNNFSYTISLIDNYYNNFVKTIKNFQKKDLTTLNNNNLIHILDRNLVRINKNNKKFNIDFNEKFITVSNHNKLNNMKDTIHEIEALQRDFKNYKSLSIIQKKKEAADSTLNNILNQKIFSYDLKDLNNFKTENLYSYAEKHNLDTSRISPKNKLTQQLKTLFDLIQEKKATKLKIDDFINKINEINSKGLPFEQIKNDFLSLINNILKIERNKIYKNDKIFNFSHSNFKEIDNKVKLSINRLEDFSESELHTFITDFKQDLLTGKHYELFNINPHLNKTKELIEFEKYKELITLFDLPISLNNSLDTIEKDVNFMIELKPELESKVNNFKNTYEKFLSLEDYRYVKHSIIKGIISDMKTMNIFKFINKENYTIKDNFPKRTNKIKTLLQLQKKHKDNQKSLFKDEIKELKKLKDFKEEFYQFDIIEGNFNSFKYAYYQNKDKIIISELDKVFLSSESFTDFLDNISFGKDFPEMISILKDSKLTRQKIFSELNPLKTEEQMHFMINKLRKFFQDNILVFMNSQDEIIFKIKKDFVLSKSIIQDLKKDFYVRFKQNKYLLFEDFIDNKNQGKEFVIEFSTNDTNKVPKLIGVDKKNYIELIKKLMKRNII